MIEEWISLDLEGRIQALIKEMAKDYYHIGKIDKIPDIIRIKKLPPSINSSLEFFRIVLHSSIPNSYLEMDIPIVGMDMKGRTIANGENKALVDYVSKELPVVDKLDFKALMTDAYEKIGTIGAIFYPIDLYLQMNKELNIQFRNNSEIIKTDIDEIQTIHSTNSSKWNQIVVLGENSIEWTRKLSINLPPNLHDYHIFSEKDDHFHSAYRINTNDVNFMIGTLSNCRIINPDKIIVYSLPELNV